MDDIDFKVKDEKDEPICYLPTENGPHFKVVALFFVPPLKIDEQKTVCITYKWPGLFRQMVEKGFERAEWNLTKESTEPIPVVRYSFYLDRELGKKCSGEKLGWTGGDQVVLEVTHPEYGWQGITYQIKNATAGTYMLRVNLKDLDENQPSRPGPSV